MEDDKPKDPISDALGMNPLITQVENSPVVAEDGTLDDDYSYARQNIYDVIETGQNALTKLASIADQSQHPRAFEVISGLMKTLLDANKDLLELHKKKKDLKSGEPKRNETSITNNTLMIGSTAQLQKMLRDLELKAINDPTIIDNESSD